MPEWCPNCGAYGFAEYNRGEKSCPKCDYKEKIIYTDDKSRLKRLIKLHLPELEKLEKKEKVLVVWKCKICGWTKGIAKGESPPDYPSCKDYEPHDWKKVDFKEMKK